MKKNSKKFLSLFLSVSMLLSVVAVPVYAEPSDNADVEETVITTEPETEEPGEPATEEVTDNEVQTPDGAVDTPEDPQVPEDTEEPEVTEESPTFTVEDSFYTYTVDASAFDLSEVDGTMKAPEEGVEIDKDDPTITVVEEELKNITVLNDDGEPVPLTEEQIQQVLYMYMQYIDHWEANADVLGVQAPFFLQFNDNEDSLGVLGEMLALAGVKVDDVRSGSYKFEDLTGMISNFLYGDRYGVEYYGEAIRAQRDAALAAVEASGAQTDVQKLIVLNTWLSQEDSFEMAFIMNQGKEEPAMQAEIPTKRERYDDVYAGIKADYEVQLTTQFHDQIFNGIVAQFRQEFYEGAIKQIVMETAKGEGVSEEEATAAADKFMKDNAEAISADAPKFVEEQFGKEDADQLAKEADAFIEKAKTEGVVVDEAGTKMTIEQLTQTQMDVPLEDLDGMSPNEAVPVYAAQAAEGMTGGVMNYWQGNHIGVFGEGFSVCLGYSKALTYLVQCMYPEYYGVNGAGTDMTKPENWKKAKDIYYNENGELDVNQAYNIDLVRITFDAEVSMYGQVEPNFNADHFWNAVKVDGQWYYIDSCYADVWPEVMNRDRVETNGFINHLYFLISHTSSQNMFDGYYKEISGLYADAATDKSYEDAWVSRAKSNICSDGEYLYYSYDSTDLITFHEEYKDMQNNPNGYEDMASLGDALYKLVRHKMTDVDKGDDGDTNYETLIEFNYEKEEDKTVTRVFNPTTGEMVENEELTALYAQFEAEKGIYPSIYITTAYYGGKLYFNLSNCIMSYDIATGEVVRVKEYNTVYGKRDRTKAFGGMAFSMTGNAEEADFTVYNKPIAGLSLKDDGQLYVDLATNIGYISGKDPNNYMDQTSFGYEFEESNYNPSYSTIAQDFSQNPEDYGYVKETNDNDEFMWVANFIGTEDMAHLCGGTHNYAEVSVDTYCGHKAYTENRCTDCGAIENGSRVEAEGAAGKHHYVPFSEQYYTKDADENWNEGNCYVCTICGTTVDEPIEPVKGNMENQDDFDARMATYEENLAVWEDIVKNGGHTYNAADAAWSEDSKSVTFSALECTSVCPEKKNVLDCLLKDNTVTTTFAEPVTAEAKLDHCDGNCVDGGILTYVASGEAEGLKYKLSREVELPAGGTHDYVGGVCSICGEAEQGVAEVPVIESVYSKLQTTAKVTWTPVKGASGYQLWRAESPDAAAEDWKLTKTVAGDDIEKHTIDNTIRYTNVELTPGTTYYYKVRSFTMKEGVTDVKDEESRNYSEFSAVAYMPAATIFKDVYSNSDSKVRILWKKVNGAHGYQIWRKNGDDEYSIVKTLGDKNNTLKDDQGATTAYSNTGLSAAGTYTYKMRAFSIPKDGTKVFGAYSDEFTVTVLPEATQLKASSEGSKQITLKWEAKKSDGYQIWMSNSKDGKYTIAKTIDDGKATSYTKFGLKSGNTYYFKIRAYVEDGNRQSFGAYSDVIHMKAK